MTALLTDNLPLLAGAPNGIKKLRELILELAVRGKLVPQDPNDEPASELLKRIAEEKAQLVAKSKIKKQKPLAEIGEEEKPFDLPTNWEWTRLGDLGLVGSSSRVHQKDWQTSGVPFYRAREIVRLSKDGFVENELFISEELYKELSTGGVVPKAGDIMLTGVGTIGVPYCVQKTDRFYFKDASVLIFKSHVADSSGYLLKYLVSPFWNETIHAESMGTTVHTLTIARANETLCPLPPLAEQHRIVAKVDELMALCDRLEAQQADADSAHAQLVQALLDSLTQASDAADFAQSWQHLAEHFHTLFTTESSIDALMQTLLQLAVMGKLVQQDPNDEPASELLKRIAEEKTRLVANGEIKRQKPSPDIEKEEAPFSLPSQWLWARLTDCSKQVTDGEHLTPPRTSDATQIPLVTAKNVRDGYMDYAHTDYVDRTVAEKCWGRCRPEQGDVMVVSVGATLGRLTVIPTTQEMVIVRSVTLIKPLLVLSEFLALALKSPFSQRAIWAGVKQSAQPCLYLSQSSQLLVPLPPLAEQHRIVAKVDQLMSLCDQLKARLNQARQVHEQLANALVEQAVA